MSADTKFALAYGATLVALSLFGHALIRRRFLLVCFGVPIPAFFLSMLVAWLLFGWTSNLWPIACAFWFVPGVAAAAMIGAPFLVLRRRAPTAGHCTQCSYDLTGNTSGRCPECGEPVGRSS